MRQSFALSARAFPYRVSYQAWKPDPGVLIHCEFILLADSDREAKRLASKHFRDDNGQPVEHYDVKIQLMEKAPVRAH